MPQRQFWTAQVPCGVSWRYSIDPRSPERPSALSVVIYDQSHKPMDTGSIPVPSEVVHECIVDALRASWEQYLFGEVGGLQATLSPILTAWRPEADLRRMSGRF